MKYLLYRECVCLSLSLSSKKEKFKKMASVDYDASEPRRVGYLETFTNEGQEQQGQLTASLLKWTLAVVLGLVGLRWIARKLSEYRYLRAKQEYQSLG
jgi:hypothetical protein